MAKKKLESLKNLSVKETQQRILDLEKSHFSDRVKLSTGQLEKTAVLWQQRKEIARLKTFLAQKAVKN